MNAAAPMRKFVNWAAIEPLYRASAVSISKLSADFGISRAAIHKHAKKHGWARVQCEVQGDASAALDDPWQTSARTVLDRLWDLLGACSDVIEKSEDFDAVRKPMVDALSKVGALSQQRDGFLQPDFEELLGLVRAKTEEARTAAETLNLVAWNVLAQEVLRAIAAYPGQGDTRPQAATPATWDARLDEGGEQARRLTRRCIEEVDDLCEVLIGATAGRVEVDDPNRWFSVLRMSVLRIRTLNNVALDYVGQMGETMASAHQALYGATPAKGSTP